MRFFCGIVCYASGFACQGMRVMLSFGGQRLGIAGLPKEVDGFAGVFRGHVCTARFRDKTRTKIQDQVGRLVLCFVFFNFLFFILFRKIFARVGSPFLFSLLNFWQPTPVRECG